MLRRATRLSISRPDSRNGGGSGGKKEGEGHNASRPCRIIRCIRLRLSEENKGNGPGQFGVHESYRKGG